MAAEISKKTISKVMAGFGKLGGRKKSAAKAEAARKNGKLGGAPKTKNK